MKDISHLREEYTRMGLTAEELADDPMQQFDNWLRQALAADIAEPNAMNLATVDEQQQPAVRTVLLKQYDARGFVFFTNYSSQKGEQIAANAQVAANFLWLELERQVCIRGRAEKIPTAESEAYFKSRPRGSQLGAWVSPQSQEIANRSVLEQRLSMLTAEFGDGEIPLPEHWGGYRIVPNSIEFWQGRQNRLHDRFLYQHHGGSQWQRIRLAP